MRSPEARSRPMYCCTKSSTIEPPDRFHHSCTRSNSTQSHHYMGNSKSHQVEPSVQLVQTRSPDTEQVTDTCVPAGQVSVQSARQVHVSQLRQCICISGSVTQAKQVSTVIVGNVGNARWKTHNHMENSHQQMNKQHILHWHTRSLELVHAVC